MRRHPVLRAIRMRAPNTAVISVLFLAGFFLLGGFIAMFYSRACDDTSRAALSDYLRDYCVLYDQSGISISFLKCIQLYFGSVFLAFLLGFSSLGSGLIPLLSGLMGFTSFYTVFCFAQTFGRPGVLAAAALIVVRLLFTLPCFFVMASVSWRFSCQLTALMFGRGKRCESVHYSSRYFILFAFCLLLLCVGICCERFLTPHLFRAVIDGTDFIFREGGAS